MAFTNLYNWVKQRRTSSAGTRQLLVLSTANAVELAIDIVQLHKEVETCWLGDTTRQTEASVQRPAALYKQLLGQEFELVVYNACDGFRPSALLALAGTVKRGGLCILVTPPLSDWPHHVSVTQPHNLSHGFCLSHSRYIRLLCQAVLSEQTVAVVDEHMERLPAPLAMSAPATESRFSLTPEQQQVLTNILDNIDTGQPLIALTAQRGRGKSTVLGYLAGYLVQKGLSVVLTSPVHQTQKVFFAALEEAVKHNRDLMEKVSWLAPDNPQLISGQPDVLLVDEAAALPQPVLSGYLAANRQVVVSSTTIGFEGSGLGFIHKFLQPRLKSGLASHFQLHTAMRWNHEDSMERWLHHSLFIDTVENIPSYDQAGQNVSIPDDITRIQVSCRQPEGLTPHMMRSVFALLSNAHYQTTPEDFMRMMDAPDGLFFVAHAEDKVVGAAVVTKEGGTPLAELAPDIACGKRRVKGHLSAQSAASLIVDSSLATHNYWRVGRIATASPYRGKGVGSEILSAIEDHARQHEVDWLATSFGHTSQLEQFWRRNQFLSVRLGQKADKASGLVSLLMLRPLSAGASRCVKDLSDAYQLDQGHYTTNSSAHMTIITRRLQAFCNQTMALEQTGKALPCFIAMLSQSGEQVPPILQARYIEKLTDQQMFSQFSLSGKKALNEAIRLATTELMKPS